MGWQETDPDQNRAPPPPAEDPEEDEEDDSDEEEDLVFDAQQAQEQARHDAVMAELRAESDLLNAQVQAQDIELEQIAQMTAEIRRQTLIRLKPESSFFSPSIYLNQINLELEHSTENPSKGEKS